MPKDVLHIKAFEGGINKSNDPRDIEDEQLVEAFNVSVSDIGRVTMPGDGKSPFATVNSNNMFVSPTNSEEGQNRFQNGVPISDGYGLFAFNHDFNFNNTTTLTEPKEINTEFICINDGADIDIWTDDTDSEYDHWKESVISLGKVHSTGTDGNSENDSDIKRVKPVYYKADNGLRVCDANFGEIDSGSTTNGALVAKNDKGTAPDTNIFLTTTSITITGGTAIFSENEYIRIDSEIMKIITISSTTVIIVQRARNGTKISSHITASKIYKINVSKILTHINRPMLEQAEGGANININRWVEDVQVPEAPLSGALKFHHMSVNSSQANVLANSLIPSSPEVVNFGIAINNNNPIEYSLAEVNITSDSTALETILILTISSANSGLATTAIDVTLPEHNFAVGKFVSISGATGEGESLNGVFEIVGFGSATGQIKIIADIDAVGYNPTQQEDVILEDEIFDDNLKQRYIFGMSYLYDAGSTVMQESSITTAVAPGDGTSGNNAFILGQYFTSVANWITAPSDFSSEAALSASTNNSYTQAAPVVKTTGDGQFLFYENAAAAVIVASRKYRVSGKIGFKNESAAQLKFYVGLGPDQTSTTGAVPLVIDNDVTTSVSVVNFSGFVTSGDAVDPDVIVAIQTNGAHDASQEVTIVYIQVDEVVEEIMSASTAFDFRNVKNVAKSSLAFLCNNSRVGMYNDTTPNYSWNERIEGFRIYMKQVDLISGGLADDWVMLYNVNIKDGTYEMHAKDTDIETLRLGDVASNVWNATDSSTDAKALVTNNLLGDTIKIPPSFTYEALNGWKADTNLAAMYKTAATIQRKTYIGNLKIGNKRFPDRMIKAPTDKHDTFPDDENFFIDVATSDGESIVKLEAFGEYLLQFKEKTVYLIKISSEREDLVQTWPNTGIKNPSQVVKSSDGIFWANANGIYFYNGKDLTNVSLDKYGPNSWITNEDFKKPIITGYDSASNKIIIITTNVAGKLSGGYIYDINNDSFIECDNIFNWYPAFNPTDMIIGNSESEF